MEWTCVSGVLVFRVTTLLRHETMTSRLDLTGATRNMGARRLLKEGVLFKAKSGRKLRAFLCSDILLLTDEGIKSLYRLVGFGIFGL
jgi:hypothetical protein